MPTNNTDDSPRGAPAARDAAVLQGLRAIFADLDAELSAGLAAPCSACGQCCQFDKVDHRLFVTPAELALLTLEPPPQPPQPLRCPYQVGQSCTARQRRPLGCRTYFCRGDSARLADLHERYHARIRLLHDQAAVPYCYAELTISLQQQFI